MDGQQDVAAALLVRLAEDPGLPHIRLWAAIDLSRVRGHEDSAAALLVSIAEDAGSYSRTAAAETLAGLEGYRAAGIALLAELAGNPGGRTIPRIGAAGALARLGGPGEHRTAGITLLARFADDAELDGVDRVWAAAELAGVEGHRATALTLLTHFAEEFKGIARRNAVDALDDIRGGTPAAGYAEGT
ncbi:hypothetical protein [Streptomyces sp. NPDC059957]|uniref:hypothetical protein n=1 Tax=Streptomyces sp. NPDC059957 TaxID=3347016 RepID=UPI0036672D32